MPSTASVGPIFKTAKTAFDFAQQVGMGELHALGVGGGAGGVEQGGDVVGGRFDGAEVAGTGGEDGVEVGDPARLAGCLSSLPVALSGNSGSVRISSTFSPGDRLLRDREMLHVGDQQGSAAVFQELGDLVGVEGGVERDGGVARRR